MSTAITPVHQRISRVSGTGINGNVEAVLTVAPNTSAQGVANAKKVMNLVAVRVIRSAGVSVTNIRPRIYDASGAGAGTIAEKWRASAATSPTTLVNTFAINAPMAVSSGGLLYFIADGDAADQFYYDLIFESGS